jgi:DNA-binding MarR family transcriptional regulator
MAPTPRSLAEEIHQTRPWSSAAEEALVSVMRTAALIRRAVVQAVEPLGISPAQYNVLRILRGAGPAGLQTLAVRDRLVEEAPGITRLIDKLEKSQSVRRDRTGRDRRTVRVMITAAGLELLSQADKAVQLVHERFSASLANEAEHRDLVALLARVRAGLG